MSHAQKQDRVSAALRHVPQEGVELVYNEIQYNPKQHKIPENMTKFRLATWNLWFANHRMKKRIKEALKIIENSNIDILCCQEITQTMLEIICDNPWIQQCYITGILFFLILLNFILNTHTQKLEGMDRLSIGAYGNVIFSKFPISRVTYIDFETRMGRKLIIADIPLQNETISVGIQKSFLFFFG